MAPVKDFYEELSRNAVYFAQKRNCLRMSCDSLGTDDEQDLFLQSTSPVVGKRAQAPAIGDVAAIVS
jgi:hypothetical protein